MMRHTLKRLGNMRWGCAAMLLGLPLPLVILAFLFGGCDRWPGVGVRVTTKHSNEGFTLMATNVVVSRPEDFVSVGSRISWSAILGGGFVALAIYFMCTILGAAVGLSLSDRVQPSTMRTSAVIWAVVTLALSMFVGGLITSLFTAGENKVEAMFYGIVMWAFLLGVLLVHAAAGTRTGFMALAHAEQSVQASWEQAASQAGVGQEQIEDLRRKLASEKKLNNPEELKAAATKMTWYAFGGCWISMLAAAGGALLGAGPTFRVVTIVNRPM